MLLDASSSRSISTDSILSRVSSGGVFPGEGASLDGEGTGLGKDLTKSSNLFLKLFILVPKFLYACNVKYI